MRKRAGAPTMLVVTVLYARVESACAGGMVYRGKKRMDGWAWGVREERTEETYFLLFRKKKEKVEFLRIFFLLFKFFFLSYSDFSSFSLFLSYF